jgi:hypothetical protein
MKLSRLEKSARCFLCHRYTVVFSAIYSFVYSFPYVQDSRDVDEVAAECFSEKLATKVRLPAVLRKRKLPVSFPICRH